MANWKAVECSSSAAFFHAINNCVLSFIEMILPKEFYKILEGIQKIKILILTIIIKKNIMNHARKVSIN